MNNTYIQTHTHTHIYILRDCRTKPTYIRTRASSRCNPLRHTHTPIHTYIHKLIHASENISTYIRIYISVFINNMSSNDQLQVLAGCLHAMRGDDVSTTEDLLKSLKDINLANTAKFGNKRTLLHVACATGKIEFVNLLIGERKANVNAKDKFGRTPIFLASRNGFLDFKCTL